MFRTISVIALFFALIAPLASLAQMSGGLDLNKIEDFNKLLRAFDADSIASSDTTSFRYAAHFPGKTFLFNFDQGKVEFRMFPGRVTHIVGGYALSVIKDDIILGEANVRIFRLGDGKEITGKKIWVSGNPSLIESGRHDIYIQSKELMRGTGSFYTHFYRLNGDKIGGVEGNPKVVDWDWVQSRTISQVIPDEGIWYKVERLNLKTGDKKVYGEKE